MVGASDALVVDVSSWVGNKSTPILEEFRRDFRRRVLFVSGSILSHPALALNTPANSC
jgi:hypothetical protein